MDRGYLGKHSILLKAALVPTVISVFVAVLGGGTPSAALTLDAFNARFSGNVAGDFALAGNTVLTCSTVSGQVGASSCASARQRQGVALDNDDHFMRNVEVPVGGLSAAEVFNSSANTLSVPFGSEIIYAELFWSGSLLKDLDDVAAVSPASKNQVLFALGDQACTNPVDSCRLVAQASDVVQETLGASLGQYRASAVVTDRLAQAEWKPHLDSWQTDITVGNIQTTQGVDKAAGWSLAVVFKAPGHELRHVEVLGGFGVIARRSGATVPLDGFLTPSTGDVSSAVGLVAFDGDLGDASDSMYLRQGGSQTVLADEQNPELNIGNSTISSGRELSEYLDNTSAGRSSNTFGVDTDRINLTNALAHGSTEATVVMSAQQDTWYPVGLAYSTELPSADVNLFKFVSDVSGAPATEVNVGDVLTYTIRATNAGNGTASDLVISDEIPDDLTVISSTGTDCPTVPAGQVCKTVSSLVAKASVDVTITGTVNGASLFTSGQFSNQADVQYTSHLGENNGTSNIVTTEYGPLAVDLLSDADFTDDYIQAGQDTTFVATVTNLGPIADANPSVDLLITQGSADVLALPSGCDQTTATRITCTAAAFGVSEIEPLEPGQSRQLSVRIKPDSAISDLVLKHIVHTGVAAGDSNPTNNVSYAQLEINHPPIAKPLRITARMGGTSVTTGLGAYFSDPDDDALHIRVAKAERGSLLLLGTRLNYTPPSSWSGTQRVNYTVSDGKGGQAQSYITIVVTRSTTTTTSNSVKKPDTNNRKCVVIRAGC